MSVCATGRRKGHEGPYLELHCGWRWAFAVAALGALFAAWWMVRWPPSYERIEKGPRGETLRMTTTQTESNTFALGLLCFGGIAAFMAANGLKLAKVSSDGAEAAARIQEEAKAVRNSADEDTGSQFTTATQWPDEDPPVPPITKIDGYNIYSADAIPIQVLMDLKKELAAKQSSASLKYPLDVKYGQRQPGQGNHAWYVTLSNGSTFRLSYGGQGKTAATVTPVASG